MMREKKALIFGGTGAMGVNLIPLLVDSGFSVYITSRRHHSSNNKVHYIIGDAHDLNFVKSLFEFKYDVLVDFMQYTTEDFSNRVDLLLSNTDHYIYLSSARVYAESENAIKEDGPRLIDASTDNKYLQTDDYALEKARQENVLFESAQKNWSIARPYITYSNERLQLGVMEKEDWLYRLVNGKTVVFSEDIACKYTTLTYGIDVARGLLHIINEDTNSYEQVYNLCTTQFITWRKVLDIYMNTYQRLTSKQVNYLMIEKCHRLIYDPNNWQVLFDRDYDRFFSSNHNGIMPNCCSIEVGLAKCLEQFVLNPVFKHINWREQAILDRISHEKESLKRIASLRSKVEYILFRYIMTPSLFKTIKYIIK